MSRTMISRGWCGHFARVVGVVMLAAAGMSAQAAMYQTGPAPSWVEPIAPEAAAPDDQVSDGLQYLLLDTQTRVEGKSKVSYRHVAIKALNERGVEGAANIELRFDPSYQKLVIHAINLRRDGQVITKLPTTKVEVLQRETALESLIYDGSRTVHAFLEDVRVGDVVEYSFSVQGHNPVFGGRHFSTIDLQYRVPVARLHARLLWPTGRPLHWQHLNAPPAPAVVLTGGHEAYTWDLRRVAGLVVEQDAPSWFNPYPAVQWGEFADWQAVSDWALPLYERPAQPGPKVLAVIADLRARHAEPSARLAAALQYVQSEVRYLGIEVGPGSHAPNAPALVLDRRYGDCKDKTLLMLALLRGLGIEAAPALVNTSLRQGIETHQPSPAAFNHVLVKARVAGRDYWLDPTRAPQKAVLEQVVQADFGRALVVERGTTGLVPMAGESARLNKREIQATLDARAGIDQPVRYEITTTAYGQAAENIRAALATQSREAMQKQYINFYTQHFGDMEVASPFQVQDDPLQNQLSVTERYVLKAFWQRPSGKQRVQGQIEVPDLSDHLRAPRQPSRQSPLSLLHPTDLLHVTRVQLPEDWTISNSDSRVSDAAFELERQQRWDAATHTLTLTDRFRSLADHVATDRMVAFASNLEKARLESSLYIYQSDRAASAGQGGLHWLPAVLATLALLGWGWCALQLYRWNPPAVALTGPEDSLTGIGGWLLLPALGIPITLLRLGKGIAGLVPAFDSATWLGVTDATSASHHPLLPPLMLFELIGNLGLMVMSVLVLVLFFQRRSSLPRLYIAFMGAGAGMLWIDLVALQLLGIEGSMPTEKDWAEAFRALLFAAIWIGYFLRSERVRRTFVQTRGSRAIATPGAAAGAS